MRPFILASIIPLAVAGPAALRRAAQAPFYAASESGKLITGQYIVKFKDSSSAEALEATASSIPDGADYVYQHVMRGFAGRLDGEALDNLRSNPHVTSPYFASMKPPIPDGTAITTDDDGGTIGRVDRAGLGRHHQHVH